jgi:hypothetical protein
MSFEYPYSPNRMEAAGRRACHESIALEAAAATAAGSVELSAKYASTVRWPSWLIVRSVRQFAVAHHEPRLRTPLSTPAIPTFASALSAVLLSPTR